MTEATFSQAATSTTSEVDALRKQVRDLEAKLGRVTLRLAKTESALEHTRAQVAWLHTQLFGQKSEHVDRVAIDRAWKEYMTAQENAARGVIPRDAPDAPNSLQLLLMLGAPRSDARAPATSKEALAAAGVSEQTATPAPAAPPDPKPTKKRHSHGRRQLPGELRVEPVVLKPDLEGAQAARHVDSEICYRLAIQPATIYAIAIERQRHEIDDASGETTSVIADSPAEMIDGGLLAPSALAHVIAKKWDQHVPFTRLSSSFAQHDVELPVSTLSGASIRASHRAAILVSAMVVFAKKNAKFLGIDATGAPVLAKGRCLQGHTWLRYVEDIGVFISFTAKHDTAAANHQLDGWSCPVVADGAAVFNDFERRRGGGRGGCFSHGRRKLFYAMASDPRALIGLKMINDLFALERAWLDEPDAVRLAARQQHSAPNVDELMKWCRGVGDGSWAGRRSALSRAARYLLNQEKRLRLFLSDGRIPIHNNLTELQARHFAVGRNNWVFYGSEAGANAGSTWLSLVLSARMHGLAVEPYLRELFRVLPSWPQTRVIELAPHAWKATRARLDPAQLAAEFGPLTIPPRLEETTPSR